MDNQAHPKIKDLLAKYTQIGIIIAKNPELDHAAAGLGLYLAFCQMGKQVIIVSPTQPTGEASQLAGSTNVKTTLAADGSDLTVSFPYREGEIEKVSYNLDQDNNLLHIVVKAGDKGLSFQEREIQFKRGGGKVPPVMFFVGVSRLTELGPLFNPDTFKDTTIINIDNRSDNQGFGDVVLVSPKFSSISEQIAQLLSEIEEIEIDKDIAQNLFSGIIQATKDFQDPKTSYLAFEMAGTLMRKGAARQKPQRKDDKQDQNASFFPYQQPQQRPQPQMPKPPQFPKPQFPRNFPQQPMQSQPAQNRPQNQTPSDWLTPKVYKGSTVL